MAQERVLATQIPEQATQLSAILPPAAMLRYCRFCKLWHHAGRLLEVTAVPRHPREAHARSELNICSFREELLAHAVTPLASGNRIPRGRYGQ